MQKGRAEKMVLTRAVPDLQSGETTLSKATTLPETIASRKPLIQLRQVVKAYQTAAGDFLALKGISTEIYQGEFLGIIGKSGAGKSTFLNMVTGVDHLTSGEVWVTGEDGKPPVSIHTLNENALAFWRGRTVGVIYQSFQLLPMLTLLDNILLPMDLCGDFRNGQSRRRALELLKLVELEDHAYKLPSQVSGGQQQRAAIARALANDPPILVADEPTGNLDSNTAERVLGIFEELAAQCKTILIVTHDPSLAKRATRRVLISDGELVNDAVAHALHMLTHSQLLKITHQVESRSYAPGSTIARQGAVEDGLYIIGKGKVEVLHQADQPHLSLTGYILPGDCFSDLEIVETQDCDLTFRASLDGPVEALALSRDDFYTLMNQSSTAAYTLRQAAIQRSMTYCSRDKTIGGAMPFTADSQGALE